MIHSGAWTEVRPEVKVIWVKYLSMEVEAAPQELGIKISITFWTELGIFRKPRSNWINLVIKLPLKFQSPWTPWILANIWVMKTKLLSEETPKLRGKQARLDWERIWWTAQSASSRRNLDLRRNLKMSWAWRALNTWLWRRASLNLNRKWKLQRVWRKASI